MMWPTPSTSTAYCTTDRQLRSVWTTTLATLRCTNSSPGARPTISFAGTRLSEQPIQRYRGVCWRDSSRKKSGCLEVMSFAQARFCSKRSGSLRILWFEQRVELSEVVTEVAYVIRHQE